MNQVYSKNIDTMYEVICISNDFHYKNGLREDIKKGDIFYAQFIKNSPLCHIYNEYGEYLNVFGASTFLIKKEVTTKNLYKTLQRNKQIDSILED
jgi:hypothetical protein